MIRFSGIAFIVLGILHMLMLGADIPGELSRWFGRNLWTFDHWQPLRSQPIDLALSGGVFWQSLGSLGIALILIGWIVVLADHRRWALPPAFGWVLAAWSGLCAAIMPPSGFPLVFLAAIVLAIGLQHRAFDARRGK